MGNKKHYVEGDLIIKDGKFYRCQIAGSREAFFRARSIRGWFGSKRTGCSNFDKDEGEVVRCDDTLILNVDKYRNIGIRRNRTNEIQYRVVGSLPECSHPLLNLNVIQYHYPKEYKKFLKSEIKRMKKRKRIK